MPAAAELPDPSQTFSANPLWSVLARCLDCVLLYKTQAQGRRHINIGELRGFLKAEKKLGLEKASARQLFGLDSQVCLGCICKGRSASESLNQELCRSLPTILFHDSYSECMYYQSAENPADDPTRGVCLRKKTMETPDWFLASCTGDFSGLDSWLEAQGIGDYQLTGLPPVSELTQRVFESFPSAEISSGSEMGHTAQNNDVQPVSEVQTGFEKGSNAPNGGVYNKPACLSSSAFQLRTDCATEVSNRAPGQLAFCSGAGLGEDWRFTGRRGVLSSANSKLVQHLLRQFKKEQVVFGADETWPPCTAGFLDLFSGEKGVAKEFARETGCWVLTFDIEHDASEDLSNKVLQRQIERLFALDVFHGWGAAPVRQSFSVAVTPAIRSPEHPYGKPDVSDRAREKLEMGNLFASWLLSRMTLSLCLDLVFWVENPDLSWMLSKA